MQDNLSRGNLAAIEILQSMFPGKLQFIYADLGDASAVSFLLDHEILMKNGLILFLPVQDVFGNHI